MWKVRVEQHDGLRQAWRSLLRFARNSSYVEIACTGLCLSRTKNVLYTGKRSFTAITKAQWPLYQSAQNSQLADGILWMSTVPNFAHIRQRVWKVRAETDCITSLSLLTLVRQHFVQKASAELHDASKMG